MKLIENWRHWWRRWSTWLAALFAICLIVPVLTVHLRQKRLEASDDQ